MTKAAFHKLSYVVVMTVLACLWLPVAEADPVPVRRIQGSLHGFLEVRSEGGLLVAAGDISQVVHGDQIRLRTIFRFKDGSIDDELTVFTQHHTLQLVSDHHIQRGPSFPHPLDMLIDARSGQVTVRNKGEEVKTEHLDLPPDVAATGLIPIVLENFRTETTGVSLPVMIATPKPRLVTLDITHVGEGTCSIGEVARKALHYEIKIKLGGVAGVVAPLVGKAPPTIEVWMLGGEAPTFLREDGPLYPEGPMMSIRRAGVSWPKYEKK